MMSPPTMYVLRLGISRTRKKAMQIPKIGCRLLIILAVVAEKTPKRIPFACELSRWNAGVKIYNPVKTINPKRIYMGLNFTFKKKGSSNAIIIGKVYKDKTPWLKRL